MLFSLICTKATNFITFVHIILTFVIYLFITFTRSFDGINVYDFIKGRNLMYEFSY